VNVRKIFFGIDIQSLPDTCGHFAQGKNVIQVVQIFTRIKRNNSCVDAVGCEV